MRGVIGWAYGNPESCRHIPHVRLETVSVTVRRFSSINHPNAFASISTRPVQFRTFPKHRYAQRNDPLFASHTTVASNVIQSTPKMNKPLTYSLTSPSNDLSTIGIAIQKSSRLARKVPLTFLDALLRSDWRSAESLTAWVVKPCKSFSDGWRVSETPQCRTHPVQSGLGALLPSVFNALPRKKARIPTQRENISRSLVGWQCDPASVVSPPP